MAEIESRLKELELHAAQHALWRATVDRRLSEIHEQLRKLTTNRPSSRGSGWRWTPEEPHGFAASDVFAAPRSRRSKARICVQPAFGIAQ